MCIPKPPVPAAPPAAPLPSATNIALGGSNEARGAGLLGRLALRLGGAGSAADGSLTAGSAPQAAAAASPSVGSQQAATPGDTSQVATGTGVATPAATGVPLAADALRGLRGLRLGNYS